jgi:hypothetical protein
VLNMISDVETAANPCPGSGAGVAVLPQGHRAVAADGMTAVAFARSRAFRAVGGFGPCGSSAGLTTDSQDQALSLRKPVQQYPYPTRIAAASGGSSGPHPPREPV